MRCRDGTRAILVPVVSNFLVADVIYLSSGSAKTFDHIFFFTFYWLPLFGGVRSPTLPMEYK